MFKTDETKVPHGYETGPDVYHCGVVDEDGYVIHASPKTFVRKDATSRWTDGDYWGLMKQVEYTNENVYDGSIDVGDSSTSDYISDYCKSLSDREILESIYRAVVKD